MKTMPPRSPTRRSSPPPPPRLAHRSPAFRNRGRSPDRRRQQGGGGRGMSPPPRSRDRREFRHSPRRGSFPHVHMMRPSQPPDFPLPRRSRSPIRESKRRSFSPKRKLSPKRDRERERGREQERERPSRSAISRKRSRSKSPPVSVSAREGGPQIGPYVGGPPEVSPQPSRVYEVPPEPYPPPGATMDVQHSGRTFSSLGERFRGSGAGPEGVVYDISALKKITVDICRKLPVNKAPALERNILNPEDVVVVRRPDGMDEGDYSLPQPGREQRHVSHGRYRNEHRSSSPPSSRRKLSAWDRQDDNHYNHRNKREGSHPIFARDDIIQASERAKYELASSQYEHRSGASDDHRVVAIVQNPPPLQSSGGPRFDSPERYGGGGPSHSRDPYYPGDREHPSPPREYGRPPRDYDRAHGPGPSFDSCDKGRDDRFDRRDDDLRRDLELRRRDDRYAGHGDNVRTYEKGRDYRGDSDRGSSDLRIRINEKRTNRHDDREPGHHRMMERREGMERDRDRDRRAMMQPSPPGSDRRRVPGPMEGFGHPSGDSERGKVRGDGRMPPMSHGRPMGRRDDMPDRFHQDQHPSEFTGQRPERFHPNKPWDMNPEYVPKGRPYFEHDNRDDEIMRIPNRGRGMMGPRGAMRARGLMRGRPFRGGPGRGFMSGRGGRRGGYSPRGFYNMY